MPSFSVVIAAYNECTTLKQVFERCLAVVVQCTDDFEIIILDDASTDSTADVAEEIRGAHTDIVKVLSHSVNRGIAVTFEELYRAAVKDYIFDVPADGEFPPEALLEMLPLLEECDVVICNRTFKKYTTYRRVVSYLYRRLPEILFGVELYDPGSTKCRARCVIEDISVTSKSVFVEAERLIRASRRGYRIGKVDVSPERRIAGDPQGAQFSNVIGAGIDLIRLWVQLVLLRRSP
ncbi:MAG: glycosyltransferase family 2 protein [Pirellulaceae bacterium]|nr:glycosyltransferase family 2 protein [Planctomycetaceae bacterium]